MPLRVIASPFHCRGCGYDLHGLDAAGRCPECGLAVLETVQLATDPQSSRMPTLRDPRGTGNALLGVALAALLGALMLAVTPSLQWLDGADVLRFSTATERRLSFLSDFGPSLAGVVALLALLRLAHPPAAEPRAGADRNLRMCGASSIAWILSMGIAALPSERWGEALSTGAGDGSTSWLDSIDWIAWIDQLMHVIAVVSAALFFLGLSGLLKLVGSRSRTYRTSRGARQGAFAMVAALTAILLGSAFARLGTLLGFDLLMTLGEAIALTSTLLVLIGLLYLVANAWWIRSALHRPPLNAEAVLRLEPDPTSTSSPAPASTVR